jgi:hypothetical protein
MMYWVDRIRNWAAGWWRVSINRCPSHHPQTKDRCHLARSHHRHRNPHRSIGPAGVLYWGPSTGGSGWEPIPRCEQSRRPPPAPPLRDGY